MTKFSDSNISKIIEAGLQAPSGDNIQPWYFQVNNNKILVFVEFGKDKSLYNYLERGTLFAAGALLTNMRIASVQFGLEFNYSLFPNAEVPNLVAEVTISTSPQNRESVDSQGMLNAIYQRATNRKPFLQKKIDVSHVQNIKESLKSFSGFDLELIENREAIKKVARVLSLNERLIVENREINNYLFKHLRWTSEEEKLKKNGLFVDTLELTPPKKAIFKCLKNKYFLEIFNKLKMYKILEHESRKLTESCGAIGVLKMPSQSLRDYVQAGEILEEIWLRCVQHKINLHPVTGVVYLADRINDGVTDFFSVEQVGLLIKSSNFLNNLLGSDKKIAMIFRLGYGDQAKFRSSRQPPVFL